MNHNPDNYYNRPEVSNSDLTALRDIIHPRRRPSGSDAALRLGTLVDAMVTEPARVDYWRQTVDGEQYTDGEFTHAREMVRSLRHEARRDPFLQKVLEQSHTQCAMYAFRRQFTYCEWPFALDVRCKWDWWMPLYCFGGDLKTTFAATQSEFDDAVDFFDWDRSRAWYMDIAGSNRDFIYAISKKNGHVFKKFIDRDSEIYRRGREKYEYLAFQWWLLTPDNNGLKNETTWQ